MVNNEFVIQHGLIINKEATSDLSVITLDNDATGGTQGQLVYNHATDGFIINVNGVAQFQADNTNVTIGILGGTTTIAGNLTVEGTTTTVESTDLVVTDNTITVNDGELGAGVSLGAAGILVDRGSETAAGWFFNEADDWWGPTGPSGIAGEGGATQKIGNISIIDSTDSTQEVLTFLSAGAIIPPSGGTAARDILITAPTAGMTRYNTDLFALEVYDGTDWTKVQASAFGGLTVVTADIDLTNTFRILNPKTPAAGNEIGDRDYNDGRYMRGVNNFSEIVTDGVIATARTNIDVYSKAEAVAIAGDTMTGALNMAADILPDVDFTTTPRDIGKTNGVDGAVADLRFRAMHAETFYGTATNALYADLAERYEADGDYEPGTVLVFGGEVEVTITQMYADTRVAGVVSTKPAFKMNSDAGFSDTHPYVALKGKVPCKVSGYIRKGDLLVTSSKPGYAVSVDSDHVAPYTAFARANEDFDGNEGVINVSII